MQKSARRLFDSVITLTFSYYRKYYASEIINVCVCVCVCVFGDFNINYSQ